MGAGIYHRQGDNAQALQWCENSLKLAVRLATSESASEPERNKAREALAHAYYLQGAIYVRYADYARAVEVCRKSIALYEQLGNLPGAGAAHNNLASAFFDLGNWPQAAEHYRRALQIATQIGNVHESGLIANNLGEVYRYRGELDRAQAHYEQSLHTWQALGSLYGQAFLHMNLAAVALKRAEWRSAIQQLEQCQKLCAQIDAEDFSAEACRYLAEAWLGQSQKESKESQTRAERALEYAFKSVQLAQKQEMKLEEGATRRVLGQIYMRQGRYQDAQQELQSSLDILEALDSQYQIGQTLVVLAKLYRELGQTLEFQHHIKRATVIFEHLGAKLDLDQAQQLD
jgi:tetratricopeptide (TPR) repeat protein